MACWIPNPCRSPLSFQGNGERSPWQLPRWSTLSRFSDQQVCLLPQQQKTYNPPNLACALAKLHTLQQHNLNLSGALNVNASGSGSIKNPSLTLTAQIPTLQFQEQTIREAQNAGEC